MSKTYILKPELTQFFQGKTGGQGSGDFYQVSSSQGLFVGRDVSGQGDNWMYSSTPSGVVAIKVKIPEGVSFNKITKINLNIKTSQASGRIRMAWSQNFYPMAQVVNNWANYDDTLLVPGDTAVEIDIVPQEGTFTANFEVLKNLNPAFSDSFVYFYLYTNTVHKFNLTRISKLEIEILASEPITQLNKPELISRDLYVKPATTFQVQWDEVKNNDDNKVKNYRIYYRKNFNITESLYDGFFETSVPSYNFSLANYLRGDKIYIAIQAISLYSEKSEQEDDFFANSNSLLSEQIVISINYAPGLPYFQLVAPSIKNSISGDGLNHRLNFLLQADDADNQPVSFYYKYSNSILPVPKEEKEDGTMVYFLTQSDIKKTGIYTTGEYTIEFLSYDGLEYSSTNNIQKIQISFAPIIKSEGYSIEEAYLLDGNDQETVLKYLKIKFTLEYDLISNLNPVIRINGVEISNNSIVSFQTDSLEKIIQIDTTLLEEVPHGGSIGKISVALINGESPESNVIEFDSKEEWIRPFSPQPLENIVVNNDEKEGLNIFPWYFNEGLSIQYNKPKANRFQPKIEKIVLVLDKTNNQMKFQSTLKEKTISTYEETISNYWDLSDVNRGETVSLYFQITDIAGQVCRSDIGNYTRIPTPFFPEGNYTLSPENFNPNKDIDFSVVFPLAFNSLLTSGYNCTYSYSYKINEKTGEIKGTSIKTEAQMTFIADDNYEKELRDAFNSQNYRGEGQLTIKALDPFGQEALKTLPFILNCQTEPFFSSDNFSILHGYDASVLDVEKAVYVEEGKMSTQLFNTGENIIFKIPVPEDINNDLAKIEIFISRNNEAVQEVVYETLPWKIVLIDDNINEKDGYYYIYHKLSAHFQNKFYYFKVRVVDSTLLSSEFKSFPVYIIGARVTTPTFEISNLEASIKDRNLDVSFDLNILDLGGSASSNGWDENYYNSYPNLDRDKPAPQLEKRVWVEIGEKLDNYILSDYKKLFLSPDFETVHLDFSFSGYDSNKAYIKIFLEIPYTETSEETLYSESLPFTHLYFDTIPTVSYRPNQIGINNKITDNKEAALVVESYDKYKKVILRGSTVGENNEIVIDLVNGTITGALIDGGTWQ